MGFNDSDGEYEKINFSQYGAWFGGSATWYMDNFFIGIIGNAGLYKTDMHNGDKKNIFYSSEIFSTYTLGLISKAGYNFSFGNKVLQPSLLASYSYIKPSSYKNSADLNVYSDNLNAWQVNPRLKYTENFENAFLYVEARYSFLFNTDTSAKVGGIRINSEELEDYAEFTIGGEKKWENMSFYGKVTGFAGGREGLAGQVGFEYKF